MNALPDGVHPASLGYFPDPTRLSPNGAKKLLPPSTPQKFDYERTHPQAPKRVWDFGRVAHRLVLGEGDQFVALDPAIHGLKKDGAVSDNPRATADWKAAEANARSEGLTPIHIDDYDKAVEMAKVVHQHEKAGPLLAQGDAEQWLYWTDAQSGQGLRQRIDWMNPNHYGRLTIVEYKTTVDASPEAFGRIVFKLRYHIACAFAIAGVEALGLSEAPVYLIVAQEKEPPYQVCVHGLDSEAFAYAERQMQEAIAIYRRCMETGRWPGYPTETNSIPLPLYLVDDDMEISE